MMQSEQARREYLRAMGIDIWVPRDQPDVEPEHSDPGTETGSAEFGWDELRSAVASCTRCRLCESRTQTVFGVGNPAADWMIIGEAPGAEEDRRGEPFVGRAGKLLDEMLLAIGEKRDSVFIANILKCRPPNNRDPSHDEAASCRPYLERQIELVQPKIILAVGRVAAQQLLQSDVPPMCPWGACGARCTILATCRWSLPIIRHTCCAVRHRSANPGTIFAWRCK
jgi:DNA polymerase